MQTVNIMQIMKDILAVILPPHKRPCGILMCRFPAVTSCCYYWPRQAAAPCFSSRLFWRFCFFSVEGLLKYVVLDSSAPVALRHCLRCCKWLANGLYCHYPPCALRLYNNYLLICLEVSPSAFSAPTFNHPSITKGCFSKLIQNNLRAAAVTQITLGRRLYHHLLH